MVTAGDLSLLPSNGLPGIHQNCCHWEESYREMRWRCGEYWLEAQAVPDSLRPYGLHSLWNSPGQNTGVGSHSLLQGIFPTQESNPGLPPCRQILHQLSYEGKPRESFIISHIVNTIPVSFVGLILEAGDNL